MQGTVINLDASWQITYYFIWQLIVTFAASLPIS